MKTIIGYTDSIQECDCCGKTELKGTYCIDLDGVELYYGSVCAFKEHGISDEEKKEAMSNYKKEQKNKVLIEKHVTPLRNQLFEILNKLGNSNFELKFMKSTIRAYKQSILFRVKKYKIAL